MSKLSGLQAKPKQVRLSNGQTLDIYPMTVEENITWAEKVEEAQKEESAAKLEAAYAWIVEKAVFRADPEATSQEIQNLDKKELKTIVKAIMAVNNMGGDEGNSKGEKSQETSPSKNEQN